jgi:hypothetical protein
MNIDDLLNKLEAAEQKFLATEVLAPVLPGHRVIVRIAGIICHLRVDDQAFAGLAVLRPLSLDQARMIRPARLAEVAQYLQLFPAIQLIAVLHESYSWYGLPAHRGDTRIQIAQPVPVLLAEENIQPFETIIARFDGQFFWYERRDGRRNPALAAYLRAALNDLVPPTALHKKRLSVEERAAYTWACKLLEAMRRDRIAERLADALAHAGGRLISFIERRDAYTVTYQVDNTRHVSTVRKDDLTVLTAGICLSGRDRDFDLTSLVGVMREAASGDDPDPQCIP